MKHLLLAGAVAVGIAHLAAFEKKIQMEETSLDEVPASVKAALTARGKVLRVETVTKGGVVTYEAHVERNGRKSEVVVDASGKAPTKQ